MGHPDQCCIQLCTKYYELFRPFQALTCIRQQNVAAVLVRRSGPALTETEEGMEFNAVLVNKSRLLLV